MQPSGGATDTPRIAIRGHRMDVGDALRTLRSATIVIADGSSGIGLATALAFARHGANIVLAARRTDTLEQAVRLCSAAGAGGAMAVSTDMAEAAQAKALAQAAVDRFGNIDVWINMAGLGTFGPIEAIPIEVQAQLVRVNLIGAMNGAHAALPHMLGQAGSTWPSATPARMPSTTTASAARILACGRRSSAATPIDADRRCPTDA